jgi:hypothetical protein
MVERTTVETPHSDCNISVATERMSDGGWAVAVRVLRMTENAEHVVPVPVPDDRFATEDAARAFGIEAGRAWIDANEPKA